MQLYRRNPIRLIKIMNLRTSSGDVTITSFLKTKTSYISNTAIVQELVNQLQSRYQIQMNTTNKYFRQYREESDFSILSKYEHLAYINTGRPINLLCLTRMNDQPVCLYIEKATSRVYLIPHQFSPDLFGDTIFEGELIESFFLVSDLLVYNGRLSTSVDMNHKYSLMKSILLTSHYQPDPDIEPYEIVLKDFVPYDQILDYVTNYLPSLPYHKIVHGMIFRPIRFSNKNLICNFERSRTPSLPDSIGPHIPSVTRIVKKIVHNTTEDEKDTATLRINSDKHPEVLFMMYETGQPDSYILKLDNGKGQLYQYDYALINTIKIRQYFDQIMYEMPHEAKLKGICVRCQYHSKMKGWRPVEIVSNGQADSIMKIS